MSGISRKLMGVPSGPDLGWDLDYAYYDPGTAGLWDITGALYSSIFSVAAQDTQPTSIFFKTDGTKMYVLGDIGNDVNEYNLSTAWNPPSAVYSQSFSVAGQALTPTGMYISDDGTQMYVVDDTNNTVYQYAIGTAWDISTATYYSNSVSVSAGTGESSPTGVFFKPDGTKMYAIGYATDQVREYDLSVPWGVGSAVLLQSFSVSAEEVSPQGVFFKPDGTKMYVIGSTGDDVNEYNLGTAWDISTAVYSQVFSISTEEALPTGVFFKPDGTKMYVIGFVGDDVNEYDLSTAWDVSTAVYSQSFSVAAQETTPTGMFFKPDGTKMYVVGVVGDDINEYDLSTAWDVSTAVYSQNNPLTGLTDPEGVFFKPDGTKMYVISSASDSVVEYILTTPWDVSTAASYTGSFSVTTQEISPSGVTLKPDGMRMYISGPNSIHEYALPASGYISGATFTQSFSISAQETAAKGVRFRPDGTEMYVVGDTGNGIDRYDLSTPWDISTAVFGVFFSVSAQEATPEDVFFKPDGGRMYVVGSTGDDVNTYVLEGFSVAAQDTNPRDLFFKPDGTKMYVLGDSGNDVNEYDLSTAWDVDTAVYLQNFSVGTQEATPSGMFFKPDGTKMYITGLAGDDVNEYDLSTAWDISTAVYLQTFSVAAQEISPTGVFFKPDGTKMYIIGYIGDDVNEYDLSTAWDVSTAVYSQVFSVAAQEITPRGVFFKPNGTKMFVLGDAGDDVNEYDLSTAWDVSTAVFGKTFDLSPQGTSPEGIFFKDDGTKMYIVDATTDRIYSYNIGIQV